jgi:hypothetical protein
LESTARQDRLRWCQVERGCFVRVVATRPYRAGTVDPVLEAFIHEIAVIRGKVVSLIEEGVAV